MSYWFIHITFSVWKYLFNSCIKNYRGTTWYILVIHLLVLIYLLFNYIYYEVSLVYTVYLLKNRVVKEFAKLLDTYQLSFDKWTTFGGTTDFFQPSFQSFKHLKYALTFCMLIVRLEIITNGCSGQQIFAWRIQLFSARYQ